MLYIKYDESLVYTLSVGIFIDSSVDVYSFKRLPEKFEHLYK